MVIVCVVKRRYQLVSWLTNEVFMTALSFINLTQVKFRVIMLIRNYSIITLSGEG